MTDRGFSFDVEHSLGSGPGRAGIIRTPHGDIRTPAFIPVGTKATVKSVLPESMGELGARRSWPTPTTCTCSRAPTSSTRRAGSRRS